MAAFIPVAATVAIATARLVFTPVLAAWELLLLRVPPARVARR
jgi:hypothetical protein